MPHICGKYGEALGRGSAASAPVFCKAAVNFQEGDCGKEGIFLRCLASIAQHWSRQEVSRARRWTKWKHLTDSWQKDPQVNLTRRGHTNTRSCQEKRACWPLLRRLLLFAARLAELGRRMAETVGQHPHNFDGHLRIVAQELKEVVLADPQGLKG
jgi:hypothetical protein